MRASNCDRCYRRKGKCDRLPVCSPCARASVSCTYSGRTTRPPRPSRSPAATTRPTSSPNTPVRLSRVSQEPLRTIAHSPRAGPVSEVSFLSLNAAGERQSYLGSSSGVLFADLVQSTLDVTVTRPASPEHASGSGHATAASYPRRDDHLPPEAATEALIRAYLNHDALIYPFMLPSFLIQTVRRFYQEPGYYATRATAFEVFSFNMVLAIAMSRVQKFQRHIEVGPQWFNARAMIESNSVLANDPTERLQAILLLCQYRSCSPIRDNSASMWHLVGVAARLCVELGLHRESTYPIASVGPDTPLGTVERYQVQEIRRRCFWTLIAMDRIVSNVLGRPFALHDDDIDTSLPREESDHIIAPSSEVLGCTRISVSNKIFRYRLLCGRVSVRLHGKRFETISREDAERATEFLADQLKEWHRSQPLLQGLQSSNHEQELLSCYLSAEWYDLLAANASLMLWRPYFSNLGSARDFHVLDRIFESASTAISLYAHLHRSRKINYTCITLQSVFLAGLSYVATVSQHFRHRRSAVAFAAPLLTGDPSLGDVVRTTRACSRVLVAIGERWDLPRHCHDVFDRLSDAVLADAMHCNIAPGQTPAPDHTLSASYADAVRAAGVGTATQSYTRTSTFSETQLLSDTDFDGLNCGQAVTSTHANNLTSTLTLDDEFLSCFDDLQQLYDDQYLDDSVMQLSQDWLGSLGVQQSS